MLGGAHVCQKHGCWGMARQKEPKKKTTEEYKVEINELDAENLVAAHQ